MTLIDLIQTHPSYVDATTPTDEVILGWLNESVSRNKSSLSGDELFNAADTAEQNALTDAQKSQWLALCARSNLDPFGAANVALVVQLFGDPSVTRTALLALRTEQVLRWTEVDRARRSPTINEINTARTV